jgi:hypothetical protein
LETKFVHSTINQKLQNQFSFKAFYLLVHILLV